SGLGSVCSGSASPISTCAFARWASGTICASSKRGRFYPSSFNRLSRRSLGEAGSPLPSLPPHIRIPAALVDLDHVEVGNYSAIVRQSVFLNHRRDVGVGFVVVPAAFAHEAVVNENFFVG